MKYGQSTVYSPGRYDAEMARFRMANGASYNSSEFDFLSEDYISIALSSSRSFIKDGSSGKWKG